MASESLPTIAEFYKDKSVIVTGATGFLGKVLLEKVLRDCPDVAKIYLLVRPSKEKSPSDRVAEIFQSEIFLGLRANGSPFESKVIAVPCDLAKPELAITDAALLEEMRETATIVLHCAATVNFNEKLDISLATNVSSVKQLIKFARSLKQLDSFVHVSTAYAHCDRSFIEEKVYPPTVEPQALIDAVQSMSPELIAAITKPLIQNRPNTYTFTKSLAEAVASSEGADLPLAIVRPSIVGCILRSPVPGWTDNLNGPGGIYLACAHRILRVFPGDNNSVIDIVPVDHCVNMILAVSWKLAVLRPKEVLVFNCNSGGMVPIKLNLHNDLIFEAVAASPIQSGTPGKPYVPMVSKEMYYAFFNPLYHLFPAFVLDTYRKILGKKPMMGRLYQKLNNSVAAYVFFTSQEWKWENTNSQRLVQEMSEEDQETFRLDLTDLKWGPYIKIYYEGCKRFAKSPNAGKSSMSTPAPNPSEAMLNSPSTTSLLGGVGSASTLNLLAGRTASSQPIIPLVFFALAILVLIFAVLFTFLKDLPAVASTN